ncbi:hypothetical protein [Rossellomorea yichunensis]|uniref:hypothetical protein n=1 Tax=Rossellomorea yichunensis TaxID=3077331 RepID=UPI0028DD8479|nr:hypothetical protein [Rossellomorea sp. YC4-1]MDT9027875.1 hypothetical protein [Rossellomorea sp. YC4-1]
MRLLSILSGNSFVMFNKDLAHEVSVNAAIIFGQLCSSYESFGSKGMLTVRNGKEYFFLTSEVIKNETALTYRQQLTAIKDLEEAGYIETLIMGSPAKKYFRVTEKIIQKLLPKSSDSSDKSANLEEEESVESTVNVLTVENFSINKSDEQACTKEQNKPVQKVPAFKKNNKKEQIKDNNNFNCNYKESIPCEKFKVLLTDACNEFYTTFSVGRYSKKQWNILIEKFVSDTIENQRYLKVPEHKIKGFAYKCIERIANNSDYKHSEEYAEYMEVMKELSTIKPKDPTNSKLPFYNWLDA